MRAFSPPFDRFSSEWVKMSTTDEKGAGDNWIGKINSDRVAVYIVQIALLFKSKLSVQAIHVL